MGQRILRLLERDLKLRKGDSCMLWLRGCVSILGQYTHIAAEADSQRPERDDDEHAADGDNGAENVVAGAEAERTSAVAAAGAGTGRSTAARTSKRSREGRDRRLSNAAYYY